MEEKTAEQKRLTTKQIQLLVGKMQVLKFHSPVCQNVKFLLTHWEMDVMSVSKSGMVHEFEVKISRSDFKADLKKKKQVYYSQEIVKEWLPNYFSYVCPVNMIKPEELPKHAGLYYCDNETINEIKRPKRLHDLIHDRNKILEKICRVNAERQFLGACRLTYDRAEHERRVNELMNDKNTLQ